MGLRDTIKGNFASLPPFAKALEEGVKDEIEIKLRPIQNQLDQINDRLSQLGIALQNAQSAADAAAAAASAAQSSADAAGQAASTAQDTANDALNNPPPTVTVTATVTTTPTNTTTPTDTTTPTETVASTATTTPTTTPTVTPTVTPTATPDPRVNVTIRWNGSSNGASTENGEFVRRARIATNPGNVTLVDEDITYASNSAPGQYKTSLTAKILPGTEAVLNIFGWAAFANAPRWSVDGQILKEGTEYRPTIGSQDITYTVTFFLSGF